MELKTILNEMYRTSPLVFGHRGASAYAPMNTLPAFELAAELGADGIELDVHRTRDGEVVIVHDFDVDETTDGQGRVVDMTLAQLKELDAGSWFDEDFRGVRVPTLNEVFEAVGSKLYINIEIKSVTAETDGIEQCVADLIQHYGMRKYVIVSSFNPLAIIRFRQIMPDVALGSLYAPELPTWPLDTLNRLSYEAIHPYHEIIDAEFVEVAKSKGEFINAWTVNDPVRAKVLGDLGVDGIITDRPDVIRHALGR